MFSPFDFLGLAPIYSRLGAVVAFVKSLSCHRGLKSDDIPPNGTRFNPNQITRRASGVPRAVPNADCTFDADVDTLGVHLVGLHHHLAVVLPLVHLLDVGQLQRAVVLKRPLSMVERQQGRVLVPLDGVVRVANHAAVHIGVPPGNSREVFHWSDASTA